MINEREDIWKDAVVEWNDAPGTGENHETLSQFGLSLGHDLSVEPN
jgi:hypothetical protein